MKKALLLAATLVLASCNINVDSIINNQEPITVIIYGTDATAKEYILTATDPKYKTFKTWISSNKEGWELTPATYIPGVIVKGSNFTFNFLKADVIVNVDGKQYSKPVNKQEYDFLLQ